MIKGNRSERFLAALEPYEQITIITHNSPDPDGIASGWALSLLIRSKLDRTPRFVAGGAVLRAENVQMIRLLEPPLSFVDEIDCPPSCGLVLADCVPGAGNHLLSETDVRPVAVLDHHQLGEYKYRVKFRDVRPGVSATATIAASYLLEQGLVPNSALATALLYALRTDTKTTYPKLSRVDRRIISWLAGMVDYRKLTEIENAPLGRTYFSDLLLAMQNTFLYGNFAICFLPSAKGPEIVGEVADLLVRCEEIEGILCAAAVGESVLISARTTPKGGNVVPLLRTTLRGIGQSGGHPHRAGGKLSLGQGKTFDRELQKELRERWLCACRSDEKRGVRLVARKEVLEHL